MASVVQKLTNKGLINPPKFVPTNICYETIMGSVAYGVSSDTSDMDVYGFCVPHKDMIFPHLAGEIMGFGRQLKRFDQYQQHHIKDEGNQAGKPLEYDLAIYNIVKYFSLCMENNPNMIDSLFTPQDCVLHCTKIGNMVRDARKEFLHKGSWHKFKGYAWSQLHKMQSKNVQTGSNRDELRKKYGMDTKFAYHTVRLLDEAEQILIHGDIDLRRNREQLKAIRRGEMTTEEIRQWAASKEQQLEKAYSESKLRYKPNETKIKHLLLGCLEEHYGDLSSCVTILGAADQALKDIQEIINRARRYNAENKVGDT